MALWYTVPHLLLVCMLVFSLSGANLERQAEFFTLMKRSLSGSSLSAWDSSLCCKYSGVVCDDQGYVTVIDISWWALSGKFPDEVCSYLPKLEILHVSHNRLQGSFPNGITNCTALEELDMSSTYLTGTLPDFSKMGNLRFLNLSYNLFTGKFPFSVMNLSNLQVMDFNENTGFDLWELPEEFTRLKRLRKVFLTTCMLHGKIPPSVGNMTSLTDLELSGNFLTGKIPRELSFLKNLQQLELYYNQLSGHIPEELGNLTELVDLDMSVNLLTGHIPVSICKLPKLQVLQLYNNSLTGRIPSVLGDSTTLKILSLYSNFLTGEVPQNLGKLSAMTVLDLSENSLSGELPPHVCAGGKMLYLLVLQNKFTGSIPDTYGNCKSIIRFRVSSNQLEGSIPESILALPHASIIDLSFNHLEGSISKTLAYAKNLSEFFVQNNSISGVLPREIAHAQGLVKVDLSFNQISGPIPPEIGSLRKLNLLMLQGNKFDSSIPNTLASLKFLNVLDLSDNLLTGTIPESLSKLLPNSITLRNNRLSGPIPESLVKGGMIESFSGNPGLCISVNMNSTSAVFPMCQKTHTEKKLNCMLLFGISAVIFLMGVILFLRHWYRKNMAHPENDDSLSSSFFSYDIKSFHRITFDQREILESLTDKNIIGHGGSGTVYKVELSNGENVAVKKLWSQRTKELDSVDHAAIDKELKTEVETLGNIRHKSIVKLYCYFSGLDIKLLVYEYMRNGNLWDALHGGKLLLEWPIRHQIALGIAQGLAYLHHDLLPPIIHRDVKSTNILLDVNYQPKVADFGIAKVLQAKGGKESSTTVVAGTYGYLAPEYAYSSKATTKCDVYSFGVVLMELITGKKPVEAEFGDNKNIIYWVSAKVDTKEGATEVLDKRLSGSFRDEMFQVLRIAIRCTCKSPTLRPTMNEVAQLLAEADPCRPDDYKSSNKMK